MSCILIHDPRPIPEDWQGVLSRLGRSVVVREDRESFVAALAERPPDVLVYVLAELAKDLDLLSAVRRVAPELPIILLDGPMDVAARRSIQELKPAYYGVLPLEHAEVEEAVRGVLGRGAVLQQSRRRSGPGRGT